MKHIFLTNVGQLDELKRHDSFESICRECGERYSVNDFRPERIERYRIVMCQPCYAKRVKKEKYGNPNYNNRDKAKETCLEVYGCENPHQNQDVILKSENTCMDKYGATNPNKCKDVRDKISETCIEKYGNSCSLHGKDIEEKTKKTMNEKYGVNYTAESEYLRTKMNNTRKEKYGDPNYTNREKANETILNTYGVENIMQLENIQKQAKETRYKLYGEYNNMPKLIETVRDRYGVDYVFQNGYISDNIKQTMLDKYGNETYFGSEHHLEHKSEYIEKMCKTMNERYGVDSFAKCESFKEMMCELRKLHPEIFQSSTRLVYFGLSFDSIPEFCVYLYCIYHWIPVIRNYSQCFEYTDIKGKSHEVYPDFIINGQFVEIKGAHFFKKDGSMYLPYKNPKWTDEEYKYMCSIYESKRKCLVDNGVIILKDTDPWVQNCINWVNKVINIDLFIKSNIDNVCYGYTPYNIDKDKEYQDSIGIGKTPFDI